MRHFFILCLWGAASLASAQAHDAVQCGSDVAQHCQQEAASVVVAQVGEACGGLGGCKAADRPVLVPEVVIASAPSGAPAPSWGEYSKFLLTGVLAIGLVTVLGRRFY